jgi:hypothetical protein
MKPSKAAIIRPQGTPTPTPMATEWLEGAGWEFGTDEDVGKGATDAAAEVVAIKVVEEGVVEATVAAAITPIVVRAEGVPAYLVRALHHVEGLDNSLPVNSNTLN